MRASLPALGAFAGAFSALVFTVVHQVLISSIWFALPAMLGAGAVCGACIAWSYRLVTPSPSASQRGVASGGGAMVRAEALAALVSTARFYWIRRS